VGVVATRLRTRSEEITQAIFARVLDLVPDAVGLADEEYVAGLRVAVAAAVDYGLEGIERGQEGVGPVPEAVMVQARRAARGGVSLDLVLRRYTAGYALLGDFLIEEAERNGLVGQVRGLLGMQATLLERLTAAVAREYGHELRGSPASPERSRAELVRRLLADGASTSVAVELDYRLDVEHLGVIARGAGSEELLRDLARYLGRRLLSVRCEEEMVWAWLGGNRGLEIAAVEQYLCSQRLQEGISLAVGEPGWGFEGWRLTHRQAQASLTVALRKPEGFTRYGDVALLAAVLGDEMLASTLRGLYIAPLMGARGADSVLCHTLRAYLLAECNATSTAAALGVARKTVESRLRTIEERLGRSLHPCPVELEVALRLDELSSLTVTNTPTFSEIPSSL
jgi:PucR C-terminal helix-turn-helix domain